MATKVKLIADGVITPDQITLTTASTGTNTTAPATTAFVQQEISALVDSSPEALNTLNELAAALGDDANFSTTVTNSIATKAPLASPTFTGDATFDTDTLVIDSTNNRVGIGVASPAAELHVSGDSIANTFKLIANTSVSGSDATIFRPADNTMAFSTDGTERMRIESSGQILITNETPSIKLVDSGDNSAQFIQAYGGFLRYYADDNNILSGSEHSWWIDGTRKMTLDSFGNINTIGNTITVDPDSGDALLSLQGAGGAQSLRIDQNSIRTTTNSPLSIFTNDLANRRIYLNSGTDNSPLNFMGIGTAAPEAALDINGSYNINHSSDSIFRVSKNNSNDWSIRLDHGADDYGFLAVGSGSYAISVINQPTGSHRFRVDYSGTIFATNITVQSISDERLKENITDANSQWNDIKNLRVVNYEWIDNKYGDGNYLGLIAQEVEEVSPNLVEIDIQTKEDIDSGILDPEYKTVKYSIVWMKAVKALQEAMERIEQLENEIAILKEG